MQQQPQHIAVMRLSAMGDVAMTVPVLRALVNQYPELKITLISRPLFQPFFKDIPNLHFFSFDEKGRHKGVFGLWRLYQDVKALHIDAFADLHHVLRSKVVRTLFALSGKKTVTVDKGRAEKKTLTCAKNKIFQPLTTMFERHQLVFESLGFPIDLSQPKFPAKALIVQPELAAIVAQSKNTIGIAPFAQYDSKVYPLDLMQQVIDTLSQNQEHIILLFGGGQKEKEELQKLAGDKKNVLNMAGKIPFQDELNLISNLDVMLSMDSGNAHIAAMLGVPVVTLWGATHPYAGFLPFNQSFNNALVSDRNQYPKLPTSVYGNKKVPGYENAMRTILPEQVAARIGEVLKSKK
jgi:ADP-heptose:LPS heptosyltransferase